MTISTWLRKNYNSLGKYQFESKSWEKVAQEGPEKQQQESQIRVKEIAGETTANYNWNSCVCNIYKGIVSIYTHALSFHT